MAPLSRRMVAEALGTFGLIFIGCGVVVANTFPDGNSGIVGIALAHAVVLGVMITCTMNISGGHHNPAVTIGLFSAGRISGKDAGAYVVAQLVGALLGAFLLRLLLPPGVVSAGSLGTPTVALAITGPQAVGIEAVLTFFLVSAVYGTAVSPNAPKVGGFGIGLVLLFDILAGGPLSGGVMNPARAFGPAVVSGNLIGQYVWWVGPILGGIIAAQLWERVLLKE